MAEEVAELPVLAAETVEKYLSTGTLEITKITESNMTKGKTHIIQTPSLCSKLRARMDRNKLLSLGSVHYGMKRSGLRKDGSPPIKKDRVSRRSKSNKTDCTHMEDNATSGNNGGSVEDRSDSLHRTERFCSDDVSSFFKASLQPRESVTCGMDIPPPAEGVSISTENAAEETSSAENEERSEDADLPTEATVVAPPGGSEQKMAGGATSVVDGAVSERRVVRLEEKCVDGMQVYRNGVGIEFTISLTDEARDLIRQLSEDASQGKPPRVSQLKRFNVQALEQLIKFNDRPLYNLGTHAELAAIVTDYMKNGVPPRCPKCQRGALRFSNGKKRYGKKYYWCPGYSPNGYHFFGCNFKAPREEITRIPFMYPT